MHPRIAVVIPAYNAENFIADALDSIKNQTALSKIEAVYVIDDASTDSTLETVKKNWGESLPALKVRSNPINKGEQATLNSILEEAQDIADWIFILHADDIAYPHWVETIYNRLPLAPDQMISVCASWDSLFPKGEIRKEPFYTEEEPRTFQGEKSARDTVLLGGWWHVSGCAIRIEQLKALGGFRADLRFAGDIEFVVRAFENNYSIEYLPYPLILYRQHSNTVSSRSFRTCRDISDKIEILKSHTNVLSRKDVFFVSKNLLKLASRRAAVGILRLQWVQFSKAIQSAFTILGHLFSYQS